MGAWEADTDVKSAGSFRHEPLEYQHEGVRLFGRLVFPAQANGAGVVVVHTAVGPHDVFLYWRAEALAAAGYTVLIADMLGDAAGNGWEPTWNAEARRPLAEDRGLGRRRLRAAVEALQAAAAGKVEAGRIGAIGYCFGGRAVLDLARLGDSSGVAAVVSFHGILDDGAIPAADMSAPGAARILMCHGDADPFVSAEGRAQCEAQLRADGAKWDMLTFGGVRHGFTNPAQVLNENPAFGYDRRAASASWRACRDLLAETL